MPLPFRPLVPPRYFCFVGPLTIFFFEFLGHLTAEQPIVSADVGLLGRGAILNQSNRGYDKVNDCFVSAPYPPHVRTATRTIGLHVCGVHHRRFHVDQVN